MSRSTLVVPCHFRSRGAGGGILRTNEGYLRVRIEGGLETRGRSLRYNIGKFWQGNLGGVASGKLERRVNDNVLCCVVFT